MSQNPILRIKILEEEVRILKNELHKSETKRKTLENALDEQRNYLLPVEWGMTAAEAAIIRMLYNCRILHKQSIVSYMYSTRNDDEPTHKTVDVHLMRIRRKIEAAGVPIEIKTLNRQGYALTDESRIYLDQFLKKGAT